MLSTELVAGAVTMNTTDTLPALEELKVYGRPVSKAYLGPPDPPRMYPSSSECSSPKRMILLRPVSLGFSTAEAMCLRTHFNFYSFKDCWQATVHR